MPKLVFLNPNFAGRVDVLAREKTTVGREEGNDLVIRDHTISVRHAEVIVNGAEVIVHDLGSTNGTFVNEVRVAKQAQVKHNQILRFGSVEARLELAPQQMEDFSTSDVTAVFELRKLAQEQERLRNQPPPTPAAKPVDPQRPSPPQDSTIVMPTRPAASAALPESTPTPDVERGSCCCQGKTALVVGALLLGLGLLVWWLFRL